MKATVILRFIAALCALVPACAWAGPCLNTTPILFICITDIAAGYNIPPGGAPPTLKLFVHWTVVNAPSTAGNVFEQIRFSETQNTQTSQGLTLIVQDNLAAGTTSWTSPVRTYLPGVGGPPYEIQIQTCSRYSVQVTGSNCSGWDNAVYTPPPPSTAPTCGTGFIAQPCPTPTPPNPNQGNGTNWLKNNPGNGGQQTGQSNGGFVNTNTLGDKLNTGSQAPAPGGPGQIPAPRKPNNGGQPSAGTCKQGYVWRQAYANDKVCVTPQQRAQAAADNKASPQHTVANGNCAQGYVWRQAVAQDHVCVMLQTRTLTAQEDAQAAAPVTP